MWAPSWGWVVVANVLLGPNQGLTWSTTVAMKIDVVRARQSGLAMGLNEAAGYGASAVSALLAGSLAEAVIGDVAHPTWRGRAVGVYWVWRDLGYAAGAIVGGVVADALVLNPAVWAAAAISLVSGVAVAVRMYETHPRATAVPTAD